MSHMTRESSPDNAQIITAIQSLQDDLNDTRQQFQSSYRAFQENTERIESLISQLLQRLGSHVVSTPDKDEASDPQYVPCPYKTCKSRQLYRRDNCARHYTMHIPYKKKCGVCKEDIERQYDLKRHIKCRKHHNGPAAEDWEKAISDAYTEIDQVTTKKRKRSTNTASRHRKVPKLPQAETIVEREVQELDPVPITLAHDNFQTVSKTPTAASPAIPPTVPVRAQFSNGFTSEMHQYFDAFIDQGQGIALSSEKKDTPHRAAMSNGYTIDGDLVQPDIAAIIESFGTDSALHVDQLNMLPLSWDGN